MSLVSTDWLSNNKKKVKLIDCSWHMPSTNRDPYSEYIKEHIENAIFFDLEKNSNQNTDLPHMLPDRKSWEKIVSSMGISNNDQIIIYDNSDVISSCRCWFTFIYFGHEPSLVSILNGGIKKWKLENRSVVNSLSKFKTSNYFAKEKKDLIKNKKEINQNILKKKFNVVDARNRNRFNGMEPEPRKNLRSGSIPNSFCLPFNEVINQKDKTFLEINTIREKFSKLGINNEKNVVFSCGSGITATVLGLAYSLINDKYLPIIYDGSWAEYGKI